MDYIILIILLLIYVIIVTVMSFKTVMSKSEGDENNKYFDKEILNENKIIKKVVDKSDIINDIKIFSIILFLIGISLYETGILGMMFFVFIYVSSILTICDDIRFFYYNRYIKR